MHFASKVMCEISFSILFTALLSRLTFIILLLLLLLPTFPIRMSKVPCASSLLQFHLP